jgi:hypothetical protein
MHRVYQWRVTQDKASTWWSGNWTDLVVVAVAENVRGREGAGYFEQEI